MTWYLMSSSCGKVGYNLLRSCQPAGEFRQDVLPLDGDHLLKVLREDGCADAGQRAEVPGDGAAARPALGGYSELS